MRLQQKRRHENQFCATNYKDIVDESSCCEQALKTYAFIGCFGFTSMMKCSWNLLQCLMC